MHVRHPNTMKGVFTNESLRTRSTRPETPQNYSTACFGISISNFAKIKQRMRERESERKRYMMMMEVQCRERSI